MSFQHLAFKKAKRQTIILHEGCPELVRIQCRVSKKRYLRSKRIYEYERMYLHIPKKFHEIVKAFLKQDFTVRVIEEKGSLTIILTPSMNAGLPVKKPPENVDLGLSASVNV